MRRRPSLWTPPPRPKVTDTGWTCVEPGLIQTVDSVASSRLVAAVAGEYEPLESLIVSTDGRLCVASIGVAVRSAMRAGGVPSRVVVDTMFESVDREPTSSITTTPK